MKGKSNKKPRGNKRSASWNDRESRDMRRDAKREERRQEDDRLYGLNDFSWYNRYPLLTEGAGRIQFPYRPGMTISAHFSPYQGAPAAQVKGANLSIPGTMVLKWAPSFGTSSDVLSPLSVAAKELYAQVRSKFSGSLDADAPDFVMYLGALDSIYSYIGWLKRVYKLLDTYSSENYAMPDNVLGALGFSSANIVEMRATKADFNLGLNTLIRSVGKFEMPAIMDLFKRHYWMGENVYTDANSMNSQFYIFDQVWYYQFAMLEVSTNVDAGGLQMVARPGTLDNPFVATSAVYQQLLSFGEGLISALAESDDGYTISGYFKRAYEGTPNFGVQEQPIVDTLNPVYVPEVLAQIENATAVSKRSDAIMLTNFGGLNVTQNPSTNVLLTAPTVNPSLAGIGNGNMEEIIFTSRSDSPSVEDVFIMSRLRSYAYLPNQTASKANIVCGTEIVLSIAAVFTRRGQSAAIDIPSFNYLKPNATPNAGDYTALADQMEAMAIKSWFDWSPICWTAVEQNSVIPFLCVNADLHNTTYVNYSQLQKMHTVALYSELNAFNA